MKSGDIISGVEPGIPRTDAQFLTAPPRWHVSDLIHATVAEWLRAKRLFAESRVRLPRLKSPVLQCVVAYLMITIITSKGVV